MIEKNNLYIYYEFCENTNASLKKIIISLEDEKEISYYDIENGFNSYDNLSDIISVLDGDEIKNVFCNDLFCL